MKKFFQKLFGKKEEVEAEAEIKEEVVEVKAKKKK